MGKASICLECEDTVVGLIEALGRLRALTDGESKMLETIIRRQIERDRSRRGTVHRCRVTFTPAMDRAIMAAITASQKKALAERFEVTMAAIYSRRNKLKERGLISKNDHRHRAGLECAA